MPRRAARRRARDLCAGAPAGRAGRAAARHASEPHERPHARPRSPDAAGAVARVTRRATSPRERSTRVAAYDAIQPQVWITPRRAEPTCWRRPRAVDARDRGGRDAAALRRALRGEGQHRRRRPADHGRLPGLRLRARATSAPVVERAARGRRDAGRQDQPRPVRHRPGRHALALRRAALRLQPRLHQRRLELRLGGGRRGRPGRLRARHRHGRLGPRAGRVQQPGRPQADARAAGARSGVVPACRSLDCVTVFTTTRPTRRWWTRSSPASIPGDDCPGRAGVGAPIGTGFRSARPAPPS